LTGLALALEFLTKQTSGILVGLSAFVALFLALTWRHGARRAAADLLAVAAAALVPCAAMAGWLVANGAWSAYVDQVYLSGPSSKGGLGGALWRMVELVVWVPYWRTPVLVVVWITAIMVALRNLPAASGPDGRRRLLLRVGALVAAGLVLLLVGRRAGYSYADFRTLQLAGCAVGLAGSLAVLLLALRHALQGRRDPATLVLGVVGAVSFASSFALSLSWPLFEPMIWPGMALAFVAFWRGTPGAEQRRRLQALAVVVGVLLIGCSVWRKFEEPFGWGYWNEPPVAWTVREPNVPELAGFRLSPKSAALYEEVARLIHENARPDEPILVFPHMPLIYGIGERPLATFSYMHWLDVCPDNVAAADAERIRQHPPAVIVAPTFPDWVWDGEEMAFRSGRRSGQRQLVAAMRELEDREYRVAGEFRIGELPGGTDSPDFNSKATLYLRVWVRQGPAIAARR
ncbi:MAG TPA: hypothetical protein VJ739_11035, partial [Gemmataceae bacterium]|nr:hypothetical protein [Gemmataceae bacterium]